MPRTDMHGTPCRSKAGPGAGWRGLPLVVAVAAVLAQATPAGALVNSTPDPTWGTNGIVYAILPVGNTIYIGGRFTEVGPGGLGTLRNNLAAIDATTGEATSWNPGTNKSVYALAASTDGTTIFLGGTFTNVAGKFRSRLAAVDASGVLLPSWKPRADQAVYDMAVLGSRLFVGGAFTTVAGLMRGNLAAVDTITGVVDTTWVPSITYGKRVRSMTLSADSARLFIGGNFAEINGAARGGAGAVDSNTGALDAWDPVLNYAVLDITVTPTTVYTAGAPGPLPGGELASIDQSTGVVNWRAQADGDMDSIAILNGIVYVGGHFIRIVDAATNRNRLAAFDATTGILDAWAPSANGEVWALEVSGNHLYAGGGFVTTGGVTQPHFAQYTDPTI